MQDIFSLPLSDRTLFHIFIDFSENTSSGGKQCIRLVYGTDISELFVRFGAAWLKGLSALVELHALSLIVVESWETLTCCWDWSRDSKYLIICRLKFLAFSFCKRKCYILKYWQTWSAVQCHPDNREYKHVYLKANDFLSHSSRDSVKLSLILRHLGLPLRTRTAVSWGSNFVPKYQQINHLMISHCLLQTLLSIGFYQTEYFIPTFVRHRTQAWKWQIHCPARFSLCEGFDVTDGPEQRSELLLQSFILRPHHTLP